MKIVDNKKDFYDFVAGEYGIDDLIVFDRRKLNIYSFLSSKKDIKIDDNRSDIMKLESAGFDKIESFRNIK